MPISPAVLGDLVRGIHPNTAKNMRAIPAIALGGSHMFSPERPIAPISLYYPLNVPAPVEQKCGGLQFGNIGKSAPEFLNPHNDEIWFRAILDYSQANSPRRARQLARMADWQPVSWEAHFAVTLPIITG